MLLPGAGKRERTGYITHGKAACGAAVPSGWADRRGPLPTGKSVAAALGTAGVRFAGVRIKCSRKKPLWTEGTGISRKAPRLSERGAGAGEAASDCGDWRKAGFSGQAPFVCPNAAEQMPGGARESGFFRKETEDGFRVPAERRIRAGFRTQLKGERQPLLSRAERN